MRPQQPSPPLRRRLRSHAARVEAVRAAESTYHDALLTESLRHGGKMKRGSAKRIDAAFGTLIDAVVALQASQIEVLEAYRGRGNVGGCRRPPG